MALPESNYTQFPNEILDRLPELDPAEFKIISLIVRQTLGYHRKEHELSASFIANGTGLSRRCVIPHLKKLEQRGWISRAACGQSYKYKIEIASRASDEQDSPVNELHQCKPCTSEPDALVNEMHQLPPSTSERNAPELVNDLHTKKERKKFFLKKGEKEALASAPQDTTASLFSAKPWRDHLGNIDAGFKEFIAKQMPNDGTMPQSVKALRNIQRSEREGNGEYLAEQWAEYQRSESKRAGGASQDRELLHQPLPVDAADCIPEGNRSYWERVLSVPVYKNQVNPA